jgi:hypothetical protein
MRTVSCWIQRADFTASDHLARDAVGATDLLRNHDWTGEWRLAKEREAEGLETCPPGVGFTNGEGGILHVCPNDTGRAMVHYHFREQRRWLGLVPHSALVTRTNPAVDWSQLPEFVRRFYGGDHTWLVEETEAA